MYVSSGATKTTPQMGVFQRPVKPKRTCRITKDTMVGVLMGGVSEEREISLKTGNAVLKALLGLGYRAKGIDAGPGVAACIVGRGIEAAFVALHGRYGEDGSIQGMLEIMGVPYTGSGVRASSMAMDKITAKKVFIYHGIRTPAFAPIADRGRFNAMKPPLAIKPSAQGSAIGITMVRLRSEIKDAVTKAAKYGGAVFAEEFIEGRELTVSILDFEALPVIEIRPKIGFYDYAAKYTKGMTAFVCPARLSKAAHKDVVSSAKAAYSALGCAGAARVDIMLDGRERPYVLEVNTVPGLTELSLFPRAAEAAGMTYPRLVEKMLKGAGLGKR